MIAIYCAGSLGKEIAGMIKKEKCEEFLFVDDVITDKTVLGVPRYTFDEFKEKYKPDDTDFIIATGEPFYRKIIREKLREKGYKLRTYISRGAYTNEEVVIGMGTVIFPNTYISYGVNVGENTVIHANSQIEASILGSDTFVSLGVFLGADTEVGNTTFIGPQAVIRDHLKIGNNSIIGMNSVILNGVNDREVWVGNPAKFLRANDSNIVFKK